MASFLRVSICASTSPKAFDTIVDRRRRSDEWLGWAESRRAAAKE